MKRDLDLLRGILLTMESFDEVPSGGFSSESFSMLGDQNRIALHLALLLDCGFVKGEDISGKNKPDYALCRITNDGYNYLDSVRNPDTWQSIKEKILKTVGTASIEIVKDVASSVVREKLLGLPPA